MRRRFVVALLMVLVVLAPLALLVLPLSLYFVRELCPLLPKSKSHSLDLLSRILEWYPL